VVPAARASRGQTRSHSAHGRLGIDDVFNLDPGKLLLIAVVAIFVLGPDKLPDAARRVGATWRSFNEFRHRIESEVREAIPDLPSSDELVRLTRSPAVLLDHLGDIGTDAVEVPPGDADGPDVESTGLEAAPASIHVAPDHGAVAAESPSPTFAAALGDASLN
jgi:Sec-independent protein translocase protein TatA